MENYRGFEKIGEGEQVSLQRTRCDRLKSSRWSLGMPPGLPHNMIHVARLLT